MMTHTKSTTAINCFSDMVQQKLKYYVYALIDPRDNCIFYIGKGEGNRVFQHELEKVNGVPTEKQKRIQSILASHNEIKKVIVLYGLTEDEAFAAEAALINILEYLNADMLTNIVSGHHSNSVISVENIEKIYGAEKLEENSITDNLLIIKINSLYRYDMDDEEVMNSARGHWVIDTKKARKMDYLVAVYRGLVVGLYENMEWFSSGEKSRFYPRLCKENLSLKNRKYCTCVPVPANSLAYQKYMGKDISALAKNVQNPISYVWGKEKNWADVHGNEILSDNTQIELCRQCKTCRLNNDGTVWSNHYQKSSCQMYPYPLHKPHGVINNALHCCFFVNN